MAPGILNDHSHVPATPIILSCACLVVLLLVVVVVVVVVVVTVVVACTTTVTRSLISRSFYRAEYDILSGERLIRRHASYRTERSPSLPTLFRCSLFLDLIHNQHGVLLKRRENQPSFRHRFAGIVVIVCKLLNY